MYTVIEIPFKSVTCRKCKGSARYVVLKNNRYGLLCGDCEAFIKWANKDEAVIINARKEWLKEHEQSNN